MGFSMFRTEPLFKCWSFTHTQTLIKIACTSGIIYHLSDSLTTVVRTPSVLDQSTKFLVNKLTITMTHLIFSEPF